MNKIEIKTSKNCYKSIDAYRYINNNILKNISKIIVTNNYGITKINYLYKNKNKKTDTLTFENKKIFINPSYTKTNYKVIETIHILVHSILHTLNYTHKNKIKKTLMRSLEKKIIKKIIF